MDANVDGTIVQRLGWWLANGETGISSNTIAAVMCGASVEKWKAHHFPADVSDLRRCLLLLDLIPEWRDRLCEMASVNSYWALLVEHWAELEELFNSEGDRKPKTYDLMKKLSKQAGEV